MPATFWTCPHCRQALQRDGRSYRCAAGHVFDAAREGYVNLLPVHRTRSAHPGDDKAMLRSRRAFLEQGYYRPLADRLAELLTRLLDGLTKPRYETPFRVLDTGCGEGYYTGQLAAALARAGLAARVGGIDIAKEAVRMAAKRYPEVDFAVASTAALPVADASIDVLLRIFAPGTAAEVQRVLKPGGYFLCVGPDARHLHALRELIYEQTREHDTTPAKLAGLSRHQREQLGFTMTVNSRDDVAHLLGMTPYYWQADAATQQAIAQRDSLSTEVAFVIDVYQDEAEF